MARPYPTTFEKEQSPMSPASASSATNTPISYKANVNRNKTKKWAEAKPVSYGGDDWGDDDEYDLPPPPVSKPTGLRQQGQAVYGGPNPESPIVGNKKNYGDLPALPSAAESSSRGRANSFDADDEKRNFSSGTMQIPPTAAPVSGPPTRFSQITGQPSTRDPSGPPALSISTQLPAHQAVTGLRKVSAVSPSSGSPHPDILKPGRTGSNDSSSVVSPISDARTPSIDYQARQDYSPSAAPPPLHTRASPVPQNATDSQSARFPGRKSSLSQSIGPDITEITRKPQEAAGSKPWVTGRSSSPSGAPISPATQAKALPFIRPADIYRRMEEEREKERQSMDSSRPSMDSIVGTRSDSPAAKPQLKEKSSSESLGAGARRGASLDGDDALESGRLKPMLEPVRERKSEYGFEGFNPNEPPPNEAAISTNPERDALEVEEERRQSVSPKLPDLNRVSGFGMDFFAPKPEEPEVKQENETTSTTSKVNSPPTDDGFKSVVNQAFDRIDDSSVPDTPASRSNSEIRRTDSESTGTTGISPIMSRVPSSAVPDSRNRDISAPSILEVVNETSTPPSKETQQANHPEERVAPIPPAFNPSHRRAVSTASRGSSPARIPDLAEAASVQPAQGAVISDPSPTSSIGAADNATLQPPRPTTEQEQSFRPNLPGGWTSYATTARSDISQDGQGMHGEPDRTQPPHIETPSVPDVADEDELEITPTTTTTNHSLPRPAFGAAAAGAAITGAGAATLANNDRENPASTPRKGTPVVDEPRHIPDDEDLTPESHIAPGGNLYSATTLDPRVLPQLEKAPPESQLRPDTVDRTISADSRDAPTPPAKDPPATAADDNADYFPKPIVPSNEESIRQVESDENPNLPFRPQVLPNLSKDARSQDEENDILRKEIIQSLSPRASDAARHDDFLSADHLDDQPSSNPARISSYLPSEYEDLWTATSEEETPIPVVPAPATKESDAPLQIETPTSIIVSSPSRAEREASPIRPIDPHESEKTLGATRPPMHPQRFSWEASTEDVSVVPTHTERDLPSDEHDQFTKHQPEADVESEAIVTETVKPSQREALNSHPTTHYVEEKHLGRDAALIAGGTALGGAAAAATYNYNSQPHGQSERRLSLAEEKDPQVSSYTISPTPPEEEHPARSPEPYLSHTDHPSDPSALSAPSAPSAPSVPSAPPSSVSPVNSPIQPQFSQTSKLWAFKDIAALKSPEERIQKFNETRHRFAEMDTGLSNWIATLKSQYPEHADVTTEFRRSALSVPNGSARGKFAKSPGNNAPPLQQPYYQQYLNASSPTTPGTPVSRPGPSTPVGSQQGFSSAGGNKITTQQVQAKGKELLHTAGIFGGKAGKAGKGLLAKGKNKLRGAGGGDKTSSSPPAKEPKQPKNDRRTSWGLPLTLSRSSGRPDESSRNSVESTPVPMQSSTQPRQRAATLTLDTSHPPVQSQMTAATDDSFAVMSAPGILNNPGVMSGALPTTNSPVDSKKQSTVSDQVGPDAPAAVQAEGHNYLNIPTPISKNQPSWDPFNATPITEEEGYHFEERPAHQSQPMQPVPEVASPPTSPPAQIETLGKNEPLSNGPTETGDVPEPSSDLSDWVIVPKDPEPKQQPEPKPVDIPSKSEPETTTAIPSPSLLDRPQGGSGSDVSKSAADNNLSVVNRSRGESYTSILDRPRYSYDVPRQGETISPPVSPPAKAQAKTIPTSPVQPPIQPQPKIIPPENQPRYSYDVPRQGETIYPPIQVQPKAIAPENRPAPVDTAFQNAKTQQMEQEPPTATSFKGLPPIRRTSTFGLGFGSRHAKQRFPIEDDEENTPRASQQPDIGPHGFGQAPARYENAPATVNPHRQSQQNMPPPQAQYPQQQSQIPAPVPPFAQRPAMVHAGLSEQSQRTIGQPQSQQLYNAPKASDFPPGAEGSRRSQDAWRPNTTTPATQSLAKTLPTTWNGPNIPPQRPSIEQQRSRAPSFTQQPDIIYNERVGRNVLSQPSKPFEQPPSSAQRYPDLFRPGQPGFEGSRDNGDLPAHYYQAPVPREEAFLPRQQPNEFQLPGVGPPADELRSASRRNSALFSLGNKIRSASRERTNSISRDGGMQSPGRYDPQGNEYAESSVTSEGDQEQKKRRNSFFGINRASTTGMGPPQSRESMVAHHPGSRTDLLLSTQASPITSPHDRKRSFFGSTPTEQKSKPNKLLRASTSGVIEEPGKKKRFSGLSNMFGRSSRDAPSSRGSVTSDRPQATRELSHHERQPIESPAPDQRHFPRQPPPQDLRGSSQRNFLTKLTTGGDPSKPRQESKPQKAASTAGLLSGFMGRRSNQPEKREDSSSQGTRSQGSQPQYHPNQLPPAQTYSDLQEHPTPTQPQQPAVLPWQRPQGPPQGQQVPQGQQWQQGQPIQSPQPGADRERGRRPSREPRYDSVPIPGGYSLVRGDGAVPVPTDYDPRGLARAQQIDPRYPQDGQGVRQTSGPLPGGPLRYSNTQQSTPSPQPTTDRRASDNRPPNLGQVESFEQYQASSRRLSREDLLARSPARAPEGQQRPYQLSLPEDIEDREDHPRSLDRDIPIISPPSSIRAPSSIQTSPPKVAQHSSIQRLVQPALRHPQSPAGYPLPDDTVFSPINPSANNLPPPPPPKWPAHLDNQDHHHLHLSTDLDRSNTRRTAVSGISQLSVMSGPQSHLAPQGALDKEMGGREGITPSPTPPSPGITPPPQQSQRSRDSIQTTTVNRDPSPDLYNASPRLPKPVSDPRTGHGNGNGVGHSFEAERPRRVTNVQEEKIYYNKDNPGGHDEEEEPGPAAMSATSYPGQEWNPYAGVIDDEY